MRNEIVMLAIAFMMTACASAPVNTTSVRPSSEQALTKAMRPAQQTATAPATATSGAATPPTAISGTPTGPGAEGKDEHEALSAKRALENDQKLDQAEIPTVDVSVGSDFIRVGPWDFRVISIEFPESVEIEALPQKPLSGSRTERVEGNRRLAVVTLQCKCTRKCTRAERAAFKKYGETAFNLMADFGDPLLFHPLSFVLLSHDTSANKLIMASPLGARRTDERSGALSPVDWTVLQAKAVNVGQTIDLELAFPFWSSSMDPIMILEPIPGAGMPEARISARGKDTVVEYGTGKSFRKYIPEALRNEPISATEIGDSSSKVTKPSSNRDSVPLVGAASGTAKDAVNTKPNSDRKSPLPPFKGELLGGNEVRVRNPNTFSVEAGLRSSGGGKDFEIPANGVKSVQVPDGKYDIYFVYSDQPGALFQGHSFALSSNGVEIQIVKVVNGNYGIRQVK